MTTTSKVAPSTSDPTAPEGPRIRFRPDLDGLRAIAILIVVAFHAEVPGFGAGFVGVDVFFVISGYLITQLLAKELSRTGSIRLRRFWGRRIRRLLPAATVVTTFVLVSSLHVYSVLEWRRTVDEALATALYWSNQLFARRATDYFNSAAAASPLLHTWSLAIEEQFYLVWPLVLIAVEQVARRSRSDRARLRILVLATITIASFAWSLSLGDKGSPLAFYSALSRAWELGAGGLLALSAKQVRRALASSTARVAAGFAGIGAFVWSLATITSRTRFPGWAATGPVLATLLVIAAGTNAGSPVTAALAIRPLRWLGRLSYSWYLWHWPVMVLGVALVGHDESSLRTALVVGALAPAYLTTKLVENPIRRSARLADSASRTFALGGALLATTLVLSFGINWSSTSRLGQPRIAALVRARADRPPLPDRCATNDIAILNSQCVWGDPEGTRVILVVGDSHAANWLPAIDVAAKARAIRVVASMQGSCPAFVHWTQELPSCTLRIKRLPAMVRAMHPDLVVLADSMNYLGLLTDASGSRVSSTHQLIAWQAGIESFAHSLAGDNVPLLDILELPWYTTDPLECLARHAQPGACDISLAAARQHTDPVHLAERAGLRDAGHGTAWDPTALLCPMSVCSPIKHGLVAYTDQGHLTSAFARTLAVPVGAVLDGALRPGTR